MKKNLVLLILIFSQTLSAQIVSEWRGIGRTGIYEESGLLQEWPEESTRKIWSAADLGKGYSSPAVGGKYIYVTGKKDTVEYLTALDYAGKQIWQVPYGRAWHRSYPEARTTPTVYNDKVYMISGQGELVCHDAKSGEQIWYSNANEDIRRNSQYLRSLRGSTDS